MISYLDFWDKKISLFINSLHSSVSDLIWLTITDRNTWILLYLIIIIFLYIRLGWKRASIVVVFMIIGVALCDQATNLVKYSVCRLRPCFDKEIINQGLHILEPAWGTPYGFFSGHASNSFCIAQMSLMGFQLDKKQSYKTYRYGIYLWATIVALSRVFVAKHYLGDIFVGAIFGILFAYFIAFLTRKTIDRLLKKSNY